MTNFIFNIRFAWSFLPEILSLLKTWLNRYLHLLFHYSNFCQFYHICFRLMKTNHLKWLLMTEILSWYLEIHLNVYLKINTTIKFTNIKYMTTDRTEAFFAEHFHRYLFWILSVLRLNLDAIICGYDLTVGRGHEYPDNGLVLIICAW